jgi:hypothetical protein
VTSSADPVLVLVAVVPLEGIPLLDIPGPSVPIVPGMSSRGLSPHPSAITSMSRSDDLGMTRRRACATSCAIV